MEREHQLDVMAEFNKLEKMLSDQVYDTIHRFENLHKQNNNIISRISKMEDLLCSVSNGDMIDEEKTVIKRPSIKRPNTSHDALRLSDEESWDGLGPHLHPSQWGSQVHPPPGSPSIEFLAVESRRCASRASRTHSSPNIRHGVKTDPINSVPQAHNHRGFPSTPNFGSAVDSIFPKNISNLSRKDNTDVSTPSLLSEGTKLMNKSSGWSRQQLQQQQSLNENAPMAVIEVGRSSLAGRTSPAMSQRSRLITANNDQLNHPQSTDETQFFEGAKEVDATVYLNVGGKKFEVLWNTLGQFPSSRLGRLHDCASQTAMLEICDRYILSENEFFFDRSPRHFESILNLYRTGQLHLMEGVCVQAFAEELAYWGLDDLHLEPCCQYAFYRMKQFLPNAKSEESEEVDEFGMSRFARLRKWVWEVFEEPNKSKIGKVIAVMSIGFVIVSTVALILSTIPAFQVTDQESNETSEHPDFQIAEAIFISWFTVEYVVRFIASPNKWRFIKEGMNVIDLLGIIPYFISLGLSNMKSSGEYQDEMRRIAQVFRIMRILRIFRLGRHITGLQTLGATLTTSYKELGLLALVVIMGMLIFSGLTFVAEKDSNPEMFISMPAALYWAIITMTSVGYGDIHPKTWFGKMVGSCCAICGVLIISLPIPIIVNTFNKLYEKAKIKDQIMKKKKMAGWHDFKRAGLQKVRTYSIFGQPDTASIPGLSEVNAVNLAEGDLSAHDYWRARLDPAAQNHFRSGTNTNHVTISTPKVACSLDESTDRQMSSNI